jgi:regulator of sigma E protease
MTILIFFIVLFVLILVHEWGHFIVAKKTGMRVDEFGIGFPPKLFGIKKGGTEYTLNALPIGGFVRIYGEDSLRESARLDADLSEHSEGEIPSSGQSRYEKNAEDASIDAETGKDISGSFTSKSKWAQSAVLIAGVTMNVLLAWVLFAFVFIVGVPTAVEEKDAKDTAELVVVSVLAKSPADLVFIPVGAKIVSYTTAEENEALTPSAFKAYGTQGGVRPMDITYSVGGTEKTISVTPVKGLIVDDIEKPAIGVALALVDTVKKPVLTAFYDATVTTYQSLIAIATGLGSLLVDIAQRDADLSQVAGPIGIVGLVGDAAEFGFASLLLFTAMISLNLAVINMLPFPALDGGRLVMVGLEAVLKRPLNPVWVARVNAFGFILLIGLMVVVSYSDIGKLL